MSLGDGSGEARSHLRLIRQTGSSRTSGSRQSRNPPISASMSDVSRSCARCRNAAAVARDGVAYCSECNEIMDWSDVIAVVQQATELERGGVGPAAGRVAEAPAAPGLEPATEPALIGGSGGSGAAPAAPDPFSQRLI